ncbi:metal ABC transporter solute-binding protein, Zn/Mn family [Bacillus sp. 1P02SD]|uniref:metal ABC transporter solute-binding protein, Zn/Mn family n=1 Tax=Bacillus sp. 1P02SD TaxID=3132264 RepID=UPI0039A36543
MKTKYLFALLLLLTSTLLFGCTAEKKTSTNEVNDTTTSSERLKIFTTVFPLQDFTEKIGGDHVEVKSVFPLGADAHTFEPTAKTMVEIAEADALIYIGAGVEGFIDAANSTLQKEKVQLVKATEGMELSKVQDEHDEGTESEDHDHHSDSDSEGSHSHDEHDEGTESEDHDHHSDSDSEESHSHDEHDEGTESEDHDHHSDSDSEESHSHDEHDEGTESEDHDHHSDSDSEESHSHDEHQEGESGTEEHHHHHGDVDPHVWLDPVLAIELAENVLHTLEDLKPEAKEDFEKNFKELRANLLELDQEFQNVIDQSSKKEILVSHAAYGYWESRYGIKQFSVSGLSPTNEPTQKALKNTIITAQEHNIKFVIFDQNLTSKIAEMVKKELNAEALTLHNLESITKEDKNNGTDYFSIMRQNLDTLKKALN